jgi:hypothetical protein
MSASEKTSPHPHPKWDLSVHTCLLVEVRCALLMRVVHGSGPCSVVHHMSSMHTDACDAKLCGRHHVA